MAHDASRRDFVKKAAYVAPVILTLDATPAFAQSGSCGPEHPDHGKRKRGHEHGRRGQSRHVRYDQGHHHGHWGRVADKPRHRHRLGWVRQMISFFRV
jgi:hypothetical protein